MEKQSMLPHLLILVILSSSVFKAAMSETQSVKTWCVAKPSADETELKNDTEYACNALDCRAIEEGGTCFSPNDAKSHASFAINSYYQAAGNHQWNCYFSGSGLTSLSDPSYGSCVYPGTETQVQDEGKWCVAKATTSEESLQNNINYACNNVDCKDIANDGSCFQPNILISHASVVMNLYYQANGRIDSACYFGGSGLIVITDPSYSACKYQYLKDV